jgi:hypothetical protein
VVSVGVNCTRPEYITSLLQSMRDHTDKPLLVYPNSGEHYDARTRQWAGLVDSSPFAQQARGWYEQGGAADWRLLPHKAERYPRDQGVGGSLINRSGTILRRPGT